MDDEKLEELRWRVGAGTSSLEKLARRIPGYAGYKDQENRRDADKILREFLASELEKGKKRLEKIKYRRSKSLMLDDLDELDRMSGKIERVIDRMKVIGYGYTGFFDAIRIREQELDMMYAYDSSLTDEIDEINNRIKVLEDTKDKEPIPQEALSALEESIDTLEERLDDRKSIILGVKWDESIFRDN